ncbi:MAG: UbiX family flavin prenyltransferase [Treponema sp.]|nr:UbiX family flavin prenyltransferase [Treponema sp.]
MCGRYLVCMTGASGAIYGIRTLRALAELGQEVHALASVWGERVVREETGRSFGDWTRELGIPPERRYDPGDLSAAPASGSFALEGTIIAPCSMASAGAIAGGISLNLIHRAALVSLKEGRPLVLVPRETPLSLVDLRNLTALAEAGAVVMPASPAFYQGPESIGDLADFMAGKILDRLHIEHQLFKRWGAL